jgi:hypothetical protein
VSRCGSPRLDEVSCVSRPSAVVKGSRLWDRCERLQQMEGPWWSLREGAERRGDAGIGASRISASVKGGGVTH